MMAKASDTVASVRSDLADLAYKELMDRVHQNLELLCAGEVNELRGLRDVKPKSVSGVFDDLKMMADNAVALEGQGYAVYLGLNPMKQEKLETAKAPNEINWGRATAGRDIARRRWMLVDCDPVRPPGVCATDDEKKAAVRLAGKVQKWLVRNRWPKPIVGDSGNGVHLLWRVGLPADDKGLVQRCLLALANKFDNEEATIDTKVFDAPRICRLYGTLNCKGDNTPERPHRRAMIVSGGNGRCVPVRKVQLIGLASLAPKPAPVAHVQKGKGKGRGRGRGKSGGSNNVLLRASAYLEKMPPGIEGENGSSATFRVACVLVDGFAMSAAEARPLMDEYNTRCVPPWNDEELDHKLADAEKAAEANPERGYLLGDDAAGTGAGGDSRAEQLATIGENCCEFWHTNQKELCLSAQVDWGKVKHTEVMFLKSQEFKDFLNTAYYRETGRGVKQNVLDDAVSMLVPNALMGPLEVIYTRLAWHEGNIIIDLCDEGWHYVKVTPTGWEVITDSPVRFLRRAGMKPLPIPVRGGSNREIRQCLNTESDEDFMLAYSWALMALRPTGEYPVLCLHGGEGTAKSTTARMLRNLIDPSEGELIRMPKGERRAIVKCCVLAKPIRRRPAGFRR